MNGKRNALNVTLAVLLGLTIFMIPFLLLGIIGRKMAIKRNRRPWLWYWLTAGFGLIPLLVMVWIGENRTAAVNAVPAAG